MELGFAQIKGQKRAIALLQAGFTAGRISHAYLFYGPKDCGKGQTALTFTQLLLCENPKGAEPCGICLQCRKAVADNHPDVEIIAPDGASLKIEQMRSMQEKVYYQSYEGKYKVFIIRQADQLTEQAANSLLKVLEEPPAQTVFLLLAEDLGKLPITIQSRCQLIPFAYLNNAGLTGGTEEQARLSTKCKFTELMTGLQQGGYKEIFAWAEMIDKINKNAENKKELMEMILEQLTVFYRNSIVCRVTGNRELLLEQGIGIDAEKNADIMTSGADVEGCLAALAEINKAVYNLKYNANKRLNIEVLLMKLRKIEQRE
ncbi:MAG: DNA polymerase III subunit delta' [Peptococcia bacterium]|jgi:DNA polymerase-3 subunit delta'